MLMLPQLKAPTMYQCCWQPEDTQLPVFFNCFTECLSLSGDIYLPAWP